MRYRHDPDGTRLPIKVDTTTNGEFAPRPLEKPSRAANALAAERAGENARRSGLSRRGFLASTCGAATTLLAFNEAHAAFGNTGGFFDIPVAAAMEPAAADAALGRRRVHLRYPGTPRESRWSAGGRRTSSRRWA